ncbi:MAG: glycosyltransferase 87 family protein, partial [Oscillospiraceae bacterium]|nr:glycosyltransferase 87 family protein [Oscillospiraceae bacterium]
QPWVGTMRQYGGFASLGMEITNYNTPYTFFLTLCSYLQAEPLIPIKIFSVVFDFLLAVGVASCVYAVYPKRFLLASAGFVAAILLPTGILNSAMWAQCDSVYITFIVWALWAVLKDKPLLAGILLGFSFAFKLQAVLALPFFALLFLCRKFCAEGFLGIPLMSCVLSLPAIFAGQKLSIIWSVYKGQMEEYSGELNKNAPSIFAWLQNHEPELLRSVGVWFTIAVLFLVACYFIWQNKRLNAKAILLLFAFCSVLTPFLLPNMHERYFYLAGISVLIYAVVVPKHWYLAVMQESISFYTYLRYFFGINFFNFEWIVFAEFFVLATLGKALLKEMALLPVWNWQKNFMPKDMPKEESKTENSLSDVTNNNILINKEN